MKEKWVYMYIALMYILVLIFEKNNKKTFYTNPKISTHSSLFLFCLKQQIISTLPTKVWERFSALVMEARRNLARNKSNVVYLLLVEILAQIRQHIRQLFLVNKSVAWTIEWLKYFFTNLYKFVKSFNYLYSYQGCNCKNL